MKSRQIKPGVHWLGAVDWNRRIFDSLMLLPDGTSYNAYLVKGSEKTALIDTVDPAMTDILLTQLAGVEKIDYVIAQHAEQDHSGSIPNILQKYPQAMVVTTPKCKGMLTDLMEIAESKFITVNDGETLPLGGRTLKFIYTPWVHWPETMVTHLVEDRILFTCDFFGSHLATTDLYATDRKRVYEGAKRYYAEIMMPFRTIIQKNLEKIKGLEMDIIAPSHGPLYDQPQSIINDYLEWVSDRCRNSVVLPYVSMHDSTAKMVHHLVSALVDRGVTVYPFDLVVTDPGKLAISLVDAATIILGTPMVLAGAHPKVHSAAFLTNALRPKAKFAGIIGSFGWGGKAVEQLTQALAGLKLELFEPVLCKGQPKEADFQALDKLAEGVAQRHREMGFA
jgi:flavorubredoxin